jgi:hypothetical protein
MTVEDFNQVDFVAMNPGAPDVLLVIADHLDWSAAEDHARLLQDKIYRYLDFVESGELWARFPEACGRRVTIQVRAKFPLSDYAARFLASISATVTESGCCLDHDHHGEGGRPA